MRGDGSVLRLAASLAVMLLAAGGVHAGRSAGSAALIISKLPVGVRAAGLSGAYTAAADDISSINWNPAGLAKVGRTGFSVVHVEQGQQVRMENALWGRPTIMGGTVAASGSYLSMPELVESLEDSAGNYVGEGDTFSAYQFKGSVGYGQDLGKLFSVPALGPLWQDGMAGIAVGVLGEGIEQERNSSFSVSLGYLFNDGSGGRTAGVALSNLGAPAGGSPLPMSMQAGLSQRIEDWLLAFDFLTGADDAFRVRSGIEWSYTEGDAVVVLRGGAQHSFSSILAARMSAGISYRLNCEGGLMFAVDYAFLPVDDFEDMHAFAVEIAL